MSVNFSDMNPTFLKCLDVDVGNYIFTAFSATSFLAVPHLIVILYVVLQRWWQQYPAPASHSDCIIFNMVIVELLSVFTTISFCIAYFTQLHIVMMVTSQLCFILICVQISFHILACLERYLAVVHPVIYMHPKKSTIRRISILSFWLLNPGLFFFISNKDFSIIVIVYFVKLTFCLIVVSFCSIAVLRVLRRPLKGRKMKERVDQTRQKAFNTILAIMITLLIRFCGNLILISIFSSPVFNATVHCLLIYSSFWFGLPSSLVLPLLFLHREGKLLSCKTSAGDQ